MSDIPSATPLKHDQGDDKKGNAAQPKPGGTSTDFAALIDAIKTEGTAYRREEQREDRGKQFREWVTIALIALTFTAVCYQVYEMIKVYEPIRQQAIASTKQAAASEKAADAATRQSENSDKSLIQAQRAWIGPRNASMTAEPAIGKAIEISIEYQNSGREPALGFTHRVDAFPVTPEEDANGSALNKLRSYMNDCKQANAWEGGSVIYPISGGGLGGVGYNLTIRLSDTFVDEAITKGDKSVIVQGCFLYRTSNQPHHSYFCYFYKQGVSKIQNLNICAYGHDAD
jgi:hypothetical protein